MSDVELTGDELVGLTSDEVAERIEAGAVNTPPESASRSLQQIVRSNVLTPVNAIMLILFALVLVSGHWRDGLFVGVVVSNSVIGVAQESKARRELQRLEIVTEPIAAAIRDGADTEIEIGEIVVDDVLKVKAGDQLPVDADVVQSKGMEVDESLLTGEADAVEKEPGDGVLSGSFVVAGSGIVRATAVGGDSYANSLTSEARTFEDVHSTLRAAIDRILRWLTFIIPVASGLLLIRLLDSEDRWQDALQGTVAAAVAMVPDGLVLLTSLAFVSGILELSRRNALAKQLSTVEVLARVDVVCLDKTGTITSGEITFAALHPLNDITEDVARQHLGALAQNDGDRNTTMDAIADAIDAPADWSEPNQIEPFSSQRKWSAMSFGDRGWVFLGAPDILLDESDPARGEVTRLSRAGQRLVLLARSNDGPTKDRPPAALEPIAIVELEDEIRPDAGEILAYFRDQDVELKVISGDNHETVESIAERAGMHIDGRAVDARELPSDGEALAEAVEASTVFGRVAPRQKQEMVRALQARGHTVAMTGDGVNDVLALKLADLGIAMGSGSPATRAIADLVLTDNAFSTLPTVMREGRKVINNVERVANLFVTKAVYAVLLTVAIGTAGSPFPFLPRQLTLIGTFSIGVPGFFLALAPEVHRVRRGFLDRVLRFSIPAGIIAGVATFVAYEMARRLGELPLREARTLATITLLGIGLVILVVAARPLRPWKVGLAVAMAASYASILLVEPLRDFFELHLFDGWTWSLAAGAIVSAGLLIALIPTVSPRLREK